MPHAHLKDFQETARGNSIEVLPKRTWSIAFSLNSVHYQFEIYSTQTYVIKLLFPPESVRPCCMVYLPEHLKKATWVSRIGQRFENILAPRV
jgi:hypothetical protein